MRTVTGPTDRVVIVGAGLGGLACAMRLAAAGREVTVLEREAVPGGRAGRLSLDGYEFDTGPTVLTMPDLIADLARLRSARSWTTGSPRPGSTRPTARTSRTDRRSTSSPTRPAWPVRVAGSAAPARPTATCGSSTSPASCGGWSAPTSSTATSTRPCDLLNANLVRLHVSRAASAASSRRSTSSSGTRAPGGSSPSRPCTPAWRRTTPWPSTPSSPTWTRSPASTSRAAACTPCPGRWPAAAEKHGVTIRYDTTVTRVETDAGRARGVATDGRRVDPGRRRGAQPRPAGRLPRPAARPQHPARLRYSPSLRGAPHRIEAGVRRRSPTTTSTSDAPGRARSTR